jgi:hypothetical protein
MKRALIAAVTVLAVWGCGAGGGDEQTAADTLTRRQRDSIISEMPLPGAGAVGRALDAQERARTRADQLDSIR